MVNKKARGKRAKTRSKFKKRGGKATVNELLKPYEKGQRVQVGIRPEKHKGMPAKAYHGAPGIVEEKQGSNYVVKVKKGKAEKEIVVHGIHLRAMGEGVQKKAVEAKA